MAVYGSPAAQAGNIARIAFNATRCVLCTMQPLPRATALKLSINSTAGPLGKAGHQMQMKVSDSGKNRVGKNPELQLQNCALPFPQSRVFMQDADEALQPM